MDGIGISLLLTCHSNLWTTWICEKRVLILSPFVEVGSLSKKQKQKQAELVSQEIIVKDPFCFLLLKKLVVSGTELLSNFNALEATKTPNVTLNICPNNGFSWTSNIMVSTHIFRNFTCVECFRIARFNMCQKPRAFWVNCNNSPN